MQREQNACFRFACLKPDAPLLRSLVCTLPACFVFLLCACTTAHFPPGVIWQGSPWWLGFHQETRAIPCAPFVLKGVRNNVNSLLTQVISGLGWILYGSFFEWYWHKYF